MSGYGFRRERRDSTESEVVETLQICGWSVQRLPGGDGVPDLLCGKGGRNVLAEVKAPKGKLRETQIEWAGRWRGGAPVLLRSRNDVLNWIQSDAPDGWRSA